VAAPRRQAGDGHGQDLVQAAAVLARLEQLADQAAGAAVELLERRIGRLTGGDRDGERVDLEVGGGLGGEGELHVRG
jgi:hypothetical protein